MAVQDYLYNIKKLQGGGTYVQSQGMAPEVLKLAGQLNQQRGRAGFGPPKAPDPGVIGRIFDTIQRPLYASANTVNYAQQGKNPLMGTLRGITGQDKTTYDKVLEDMGISGGWQRAAMGFGLDIGLDPTTYVGAGIVKNTAEGAAKKAGVEAMMAAAEKSIPEQAATRYATEILDASRKIETRGTTKVVTQMPAAEAKAAGVEKLTSELHDIYHTASDKVLAEGRGKVYLKFMGKQTPIASEALYQAGSGLANLANKSKYVRGVAAAFKPTATMRQGTNDLLREAVGWSLFDGDQALLHLKAALGKDAAHLPGGLVDDLWGGLSEGERTRVMHGIESGEDLSMHPVEGTGKTLEDYKTLMGNFWDEQINVENNMNIRKAEAWMPQYVPHIYNGGTAEEQAIFKKGRMKNFTDYQKKVSDLLDKGVSINDLPKFDNSAWNLQAAADAGLKPETDVLQAAGQRTIKSFKQQAIYRFHNAVAKEFGIDLAEGLPGGAGKAGLKSFADKAGLEAVPSKYFGAAGEKGTLYFDKEIANILNKGVTSKLEDPAAGSELLKLFDNVQRTWKLSMTAVNPGHHVRNFMGDVFLNYEDGVKNPFVYDQSARVLKNWKENPKAVMFNVGDRTINGEEIMRLFSRFGGKAGFFRQEYAGIGVETGFGQGIKNAPGRAIEKIREVSELREDWTRLAHFMDVLQKEGGHVKTIEELNDVARQAGRRVRKFNIDYGDLTDFERKFMKRVVPFYTWMRKNIPLQLETLALDPGKINVIPKGLRALQQVVGQDPNAQAYGLNVVPKWLREMSGVRIFGEGMGRNQVYWNPSVFPAMDIAQYAEGGPQGISAQLLGATTPALRIPIEKAMGRRISTGAPLNEPGLAYAGQQIVPPGALALSSILRGRGEATDWSKLFGGSLYNIGPQQNLGELRRQQDIVQGVLKKKRPQQAKSWER